MLKLFIVMGVMLGGGYAAERYVTHYFESKKKEIQTVKEIMNEGGIDALEKWVKASQGPERDGKDVFGETPSATTEDKTTKFYQATLVLKHECMAKKWPNGSGVHKYLSRSVAHTTQPNENISVDVKIADLKEYENLKKAIKKDLCIASYILHD